MYYSYDVTIKLFNNLNNWLYFIILSIHTSVMLTGIIEILCFVPFKMRFIRILCYDFMSEFQFFLSLIISIIAEHRIILFGSYAYNFRKIVTRVLIVFGKIVKKKKRRIPLVFQKRISQYKISLTAFPIK